MGWCSGTSIFDNMTKFVLESDYSDQIKEDLIFTLADTLEDEDWDCQDDSRYYSDPIVTRVMRRLHPEWDWE